MPTSASDSTAMGSVTPLMVVKRRMPKDGPVAASAEYAINRGSCRAGSFCSVRKWRNWQTRKPQELVPARAWRFESSLPHQTPLARGELRLARQRVILRREVCPPFNREERALQLGQPLRLSRRRCGAPKADPPPLRLPLFASYGWQATRFGPKCRPRPGWQALRRGPRPGSRQARAGRSCHFHVGREVPNIARSCCHFDGHLALGRICAEVSVSPDFQRSRAILASAVSTRVSSDQGACGPRELVPARALRFESCLHHKEPVTTPSRFGTGTMNAVGCRSTDA